MENFDIFKDTISKEIDDMKKSDPNNEKTEELEDFFNIFLNSTDTSQNKNNIEQEINKLEQIEKNKTKYKKTVLFILISALIALIIWSYFCEIYFFKVLIILLVIFIFSRIYIAFKIKQHAYLNTKKSAKDIFDYTKKLYENDSKK